MPPWSSVEEIRPSSHTAVTSTSNREISLIVTQRRRSYEISYARGDIFRAVAWSGYNFPVTASPLLPRFICGHAGYDGPVGREREREWLAQEIEKERGGGSEKAKRE